MSEARLRRRSVADIIDGEIVATVEIASQPERVFRALTSAEICSWWVRSGVFDTREWTGDVKVGGVWRASGMSRGKPYQLQGEFIEIDPPRRLVHTWRPVGEPIAPSTVTYLLEPTTRGTRLTVRHAGLTVAPARDQINLGWQTSLDTLADILGRA